MLALKLKESRVIYIEIDEPRLDKKPLYYNDIVERKHLALNTEIDTTQVQMILLMMILRSGG